VLPNESGQTSALRMVFSQLAKYYRPMLKTIALFIAVTAAVFAEGSDNEQAQIWNLEKAYLGIREDQ
jgi:hypothetical protein